MGDSSTANSEPDSQNVDESSNIDPAVAIFVSDLLQYQLSQAGFEWSSSVLDNRDTGNQVIAEDVVEALRSLTDEFSSQFREQLVDLCDRLEMNVETIKPTIEGVARELFSDGIKWARIVALFVFGTELSMHCKNLNMPELINDIAREMSSYISEHLLPWINENGGWAGLLLI